MSDDAIPRRRFLVGAGAAGTAVATALAPTLPARRAAQPAAPASAPTPAAGAEPEPRLTLTATEWDFFFAAVDTFIPADELTPSASDCGVVTFIDRQLAGAWGGGAKMYRRGRSRRARRSKAINCR